MNINSYYLFDITKINQFLQTNIWIIEYFYSTIKLFYHRVRIVNVWHGVPFKAFHHSKYFTEVVNRQIIFTVTSTYFYNYFKNKCKINEEILNSLKK